MSAPGKGEGPLVRMIHIPMHMSLGSMDTEGAHCGQSISACHLIKRPTHLEGITGLTSDEIAANGLSGREKFDSSPSKPESHLCCLELLIGNGGGLDGQRGWECRRSYPQGHGYTGRLPGNVMCKWNGVKNDHEVLLGVREACHPVECDSSIRSSSSLTARV